MVRRKLPSPLTAAVYTHLGYVTAEKPLTPPNPPLPQGGEGGERGCSNFMENWAQRDLCISRSPLTGRGWGWGKTPYQFANTILEIAAIQTKPAYAG